MHIAFLTSEYPDPRIDSMTGGIGSFVKNFADTLSINGHRVTIFVYSQKHDNSFYDGKITIHTIKKQVLKGTTWWINRKYIERFVNKIIVQQKIDIIEAAEWSGITAFMSFRIPLVVRLHGSDTFFCHLEQRNQKWKNYFFEKKALNSADAIVAVSAFVGDKTKELFGLKKKIKTIYNAIDIKEFNPDHKIIKEKSILYFGAIIRKKGVLALAEIFNKICEIDSTIQLTVLGRDVMDVIEKKSTKHLFEELLTERARKQVNLLDPVPYSEVKKYIRASDVVVLPSFAEAFPMTWLESMALEKKMVTSDIGWAKELMIDGQTGYCCNPLNSNDFAAKIMQLINDAELAAIMGQNARKRIQKSFNQEKAYFENYTFYKQIIDNEI
jgi:glycosyltransferase involved in cell wall biosynthesis